jgi:hypothetical protein
MINWSYGQNRTLSGKVMDMKTNAPVEFAHVFLSNTTYGKTSDVSGRFYMDKLPAEEFILVVSIVGYETFSGKINLTEKNIQNLIVKLQPKIVELEGVSITGKSDKKWKRLYNIFKKEFIGETDNSKNCEIENPWVVEFKEKSNTGNLSAEVSEPVIVINRSLGYKVKYYLEEFSYSGGNLRFYGFPIFELLEPEDETEEKHWVENRELAYTGSVRHFFYSLVNQRYEKEGFTVIKLNDYLPYNYIGSDDIRERELNSFELKNMIKEISGGQIVTYLVKFNCNIEVNYVYKSLDGSNRQISTTVFSRLKPLNPEIRCSRTGWVNVLDFEVAGDWANRRVADLLPYEYIPIP